ncbi:unnamed protein product [Rotaria sp. Silwood1]|nr:unnamed protein product [Rotaria sp. Silwood1]
MSLQTCVERLFKLNSNYSYPEQAFNQASSLQTLSDDLYTDPLRFVYELVQNADDASSTYLQIALIENGYLIVSHNGKLFDENDVRSLCAVNKSTKICNSQTAGYKGLGFKAIFGKSDYVLIVTNNGSFRFDSQYKFNWTWSDVDQTTWEHDNKRKFTYPWQICPIWTENKQIPKSIRTWLSNSKTKMPVNIIIRLRNIIETRNALEELATKPQTFLFVQHIRQVEFLGIPTTSIVHIEQESDGSIKLLYNNNQSSRWLVSERKVPIPQEVREDTRLPAKLHNVSSTIIGLAAMLHNDNPRTFIPLSNNDSVLFAFMPTKISTYNLPLLVSAHFLTNANREQIHTDSIWNQWLFECIPCETIEWIITLIKMPNWKNTAYDLLPMLTQNRDSLASKYNQSCSNALKHKKFICNTHGEDLTLSEAIIDLTHLSNQQFIGTEPIRIYSLRQYAPQSRLTQSHPFIVDHHRLRELGVQIFTWEQAIDMFQSREFQKKFSVNCNIQLISYLYGSQADAEISKLLHRIPFIMDRNKCLQIPTNIYFPSEFNDISWYSCNTQEAYVHEDLVNRLQSHHIKWLEQLGVTFKTDLSFFYHTIIPQASTFINVENALHVIQRLYYLYVNGQLHPDDLKNLGELSLLTKADTLVPANRLYLSAEYQPSLSIDNFFPKMPHLFVSTSYMQNDFHIEWRYFFVLLGVQENINLIPLNDNSRLFQQYHEDQMKIIFGLNSNQVHRYKYRLTITFLELTENNFDFARFFWQHAIQNINVRDLTRSEIAYWGQINKRGATHGSDVNTFPQWFVLTRPCIPVQILSSNDIYQKECFKSIHVYSNRLNPSIGRYLPTFKCTPNGEPLSDEWLKFFRFKTELSIDDYINILHQIYVRNLTGYDFEDDLCIQKIYTNLLNILSNTDINQRQLYREKCLSKSICLMSERNNLFMPSEELSFWSIDTLQSPSELHVLKLDVNNHHHKNLSYLLYIFNINHIEMKDLKLIPISDVPCHELTNRLQKCYLSLLFDFHKIKGKNEFNQFDSIQYFEAERLELYIDKLNIFVGNVSTHVNNNCLYITKPWNSNSVLKKLPRKICEFLKVPIDLFETHVNTLLTTSSIDDYFIQLGIIPANNDSSNDQITKLIERDNLELFNRLPHFSLLCTSAKLLIAGLEAQHSMWTGCIYHYTHLENAVSILRDQTIKSRHLCKTTNFKDSSAYDFMSEIDDQVNHYVRFYFRPLTLTQLNNENLGSSKSKKRNNYTPMCPVPIFFRINLQAILNILDLQWKVSIGDMSRKKTEYDCTIDTIKRFDFCGLFNDSDTNRCKEFEFLIENQLDLRLLPYDAITLVFQDSDAKESLKSILSTQIYNCEIKRNYFGQNPRIFINHDSEQDHISVMIDGKTERQGEIFIVQIKSNENKQRNNLACQGNIDRVFHCDGITTIYGKEKQLNVFVGNQPYAVYYQYEKQSWLIYSNHNKPDLDDSYKIKYREFIPYD